MSSTIEVSSESQRLLGQVKWFNNKAGYGFITVSDGEQAGKDIFIHFSSINVAKTQYTYLVQGEYVEFVLDKSTAETHEFQATQVSGVKGGRLMCETRRIANDGAESRPQGSYRKYRVPRDQEAAPLEPSSQSADVSEVEFVKVERSSRTSNSGRGGRGRGRGGRGGGRGGQ